MYTVGITVHVSLLFGVYPRMEWTFRLATEWPDVMFAMIDLSVCVFMQY